MPPRAPHQRVAEDLRRRIAAGEWPPGALLPSRAQLAAEYGLPETTVRLAVRGLKQAGEVEGRAGARLRVAHRSAMRTLADPDADWPYDTETVESGVRRAPAGVAARLRLPAGSRVEMLRVECLDPGGRPAMLVTTWRAGLRRAHVGWVGELVVRAVSGEEAAVLGLASGVLVHELARTRLDGAGRPVETADLLLPVDRWAVRLRM